MDVKIINDDKYLWHYEGVNNTKIYFRGLFRYDDKCFYDSHACKKLNEIFSMDLTAESSPPFSLIDIFKENILKLHGHFSFIIDGRDFILASVDRIRSYPIFYCNKGNSFFASNSAIKLQVEAGLHEKDKISLLEFEMAGYVTGRNTLFEDLFQLQAGEFLLFDKKASNLEVVCYYCYWTDETVEKTEDELLNELHEVTNKVFSDMVETLSGKPIFIPLSGGLDSRLILAMLHEMKYDNLTTFSYGIPGYWEIKQAKRIAEYLKVRWHYIPYETRKIKKLFYTSERKNYFNFASGLSSVPFLSDFYALWMLRNDKIIPDDCIIINGQSGDYLTGGHIPPLLKEYGKEKIHSSLLLKSIIDKHFSLWQNLKSKDNLALITNRILHSLRLDTESELTKINFAKYYELYEWQERQSKYVVNGQRMYDWFGYDWRLPLWDDGLMDFWVRVDWVKKYAQALHQRYLKKYDIAGVFNMQTLPQPPYMPFFIKILNKTFALTSRITAKDINLYIQKYSRYFMSYAPFYPQQKYSEYLKDSQWHRNVVSYLSRNIIDNLQKDSEFK